MANYDVDTKISDVLVHITYPDNKETNITVTGYAINRKPRFRIEGMKDCRKVAKNKDELNMIVARVVNTLMDKYQRKDVVEQNKKYLNKVDNSTIIGHAFLELKLSLRSFNKDWGESTQHAYMVFYEKEVIPAIQYCYVSDDFGPVEFNDLAEKLAKKTYRNANFEGESIQDAKNSIIRKLTYAYPIFAELRFIEPRIPDLYLKSPDLIPNKKNIKEQMKSLPLPIYLKYRELLKQDVKTMPLFVRAGVLMENGALRTSEAAASNQTLYEEFDDHLMIWVFEQEKNKKRAKVLKTRNGYRYVIADDWGSAVIKECDENIGPEFVTDVSPLTSQDVREYVTGKLIEAGLTKEYINEANNELQESQRNGCNKDCDVAAYILRRNRASIWRNYCGYSQKELDYALGHIPAGDKKSNEDMNKYETRKALSDKNRRFDLNPELSQSPKHDPIKIYPDQTVKIIPFNAYRLKNYSDKAVEVTIRAATAEKGEAVILKHNRGIQSTFVANKRVKENDLAREHSEIIGIVDEEM